MIAWICRLAHRGYAAYLTHRIRERTRTNHLMAPFVHGHRPKPGDDPAGRCRPLTEHEHRALELIEAGERRANEREV